VNANSPKIAVILLNWNNTDDTRACLDSLEKGSYKAYHVFLLDNGSRRNEKQKLKKIIQNRPNITPIFLSENKGFAAGNNIALKTAVSEPFDYFLLLNNDTVVSEDFLEALVRCARQHPEAGGFGVKIFYFDAPDRLWYAGGKVEPLGARVRQFGFRQVDSGQWDRPQPVSFVTGCAFFIPRHTVETVGYLDETFFSYFEDVDYSLRIQQNGRQLWYCPEAKLWHKVGAGAETRAYSPYYLYYQTRNRLWAFARGRSVGVKIYLWGLNFSLYFLGRLGYLVFSFSENKGAKMKAVFWGFFHSLTHRTGRNARWEA